ncbi:MAG: TetR/AcrR family transcriptional regulator [Thermoleophilia bacterium]
MEKIPPRSGLTRAEVVENQRARIFAGFATALAYHGYEDTKVTDIVELAGVSRATFYERFESKELCFAAAYEDGVERLADAIGEAANGERDWANQLSAGLSAGLAFLAANPPLGHLLFVESLAAARSARLEHEGSLIRLAEALRPPSADGAEVSVETARILAGGLASHLSGRILAGEAERLSELHDALVQYLLAPSLPALHTADEPALHTADERRAAAL